MAETIFEITILSMILYIVLLHYQTNVGTRFHPREIYKTDADAMGYIFRCNGSRLRKIGLFFSLSYLSWHEFSPNKKCNAMLEETFSFIDFYLHCFAILFKDNKFHLSFEREDFALVVELYDLIEIIRKQIVSKRIDRGNLVRLSCTRAKGCISKFRL